MEGKPLLQLSHVGKSFRQEHSIVTAFHDISFGVARKELVSIVGPSGCGKSTLLRMICGLDKPTEGQISWDDEGAPQGQPRSFLVFQSYALYPWMTVRENIDLGLEMRALDDAERKRRTDFAIAQTALEGMANAYPSELSAGTKQRVGIARAIALAPTLLCMDEPFSTLDVLTERSLVEETLEIWQRKDFPCDAILMVTHSIEEAIYMSDRILVLSAKPTRVADIIAVDLPHPRDPESPEFKALTKKILERMA